MNIVVTGANRGLGFELTKIFSENGHNVAACYYKGTSYEELVALSEKYGSIITLVPMDVTKEEDVIKASKAIHEKLYPVNAVISNAGILCDQDRKNDILEMLSEDLRLSLEVNVTGPAMVIRYFYPLMEKSLGSTFITITSEGGSMQNVGTGFPAYSISKSAANKLIAIFKVTCPDIRVFAMHPGRMNTVMGRTTAQIEPTESAQSIYRIITGEIKVEEDQGWFIDYKGKQMTL